MRHSVVRCSAVLLVGGTLGLAGTAEAGLTATSAFFNFNAGGVYATNYDTSALSSPLSAIGANSSVSFGGFTQLGFVVNAASDGDEIWSVFGASIGFSTDSITTVRLTGNIDSSSATVYLVDMNTNTALFMRASGSGAWDSGDIQLAAGGNYLVGVNGPLTFANGGNETGTVINFAVVPAPGAAALIGLAGLASRRRRA